jgi:4-amino-4-deoxy-L-arabinose transferase-like glycosyltransferase
MTRLQRRRTVSTMTKHSMKLMWGCIAIVAFVIVAAVAGARPGYVLFALPCMLMMGAMMWMMIGASGRDSGRGEPKK